MPTSALLLDCWDITVSHAEQATFLMNLYETGSGLQSEFHRHLFRRCAPNLDTFIAVAPETLNVNWKWDMQQSTKAPPEIQRIFDSQAREIAVRVDRFFSFLLIIQWLVAIALTLWGPFERSFPLAIGVASLLSIPAVTTTFKFSGKRWNRFLIGFSQMGFSVYFNWLTHGRAETQIHIFVSLATLAFYKDSPLLILSSFVAVIDYLFLGLNFGGSMIEMRWFELMGWILVEDFILISGIHHIRAELWEMATSKFQLQEAKAEALGLSTTKSNFLSRMSHEIRTPLNSIIGFTDILRETNLDYEQKNYVSTIQRCSDALLHLINDILDISKIESGLLEIDRHPFDIHELHRDIHKMFAPKCEEKGLHLHVMLDERSPRMVEGDSHRLRQVLINLVGNAVKFTDRGNVRVEVYRNSATRTYEWKVSDTGRGINPGNISKLFRSYFQEDPSVSRKFGGSGLGLMISKNLIEMMGGGIEVESKQGEGTVFQFSLPISEVYRETSE